MSDQSVPLQRVFPNEFGTRHAGYANANVEPTPRSRAMRHRIFIFSGVFVLCLLVSLSYTFLRSPIFMANARVLVTPAERVALRDTPAVPDAKPDFLSEVQILTSRPLLEKVVKKLQELGHLKGLDADPIMTVQNMLTVTPVEGTQMVQLQAQGPEQALVARLINTLIETYRDEQAATGNAASQAQLLETRQALQVIEANVAEKKKNLEAYRLQSNIVSSERDENQTLSRLRGLSTSLSTATDREAIAAGRVRAIEQAIAEGKRTPQAKDNPTVANIEARLSQAREEWRALERQFTPQYMDMDAPSKALKTRISNLELQLDGERQKSQQMGLAEAREDLASVRAATQRLQQQLADDKQSVQVFSRRFSEYQGMQEEMKGLEEMRQNAKKKLLAMESSETARRPRILVVEPAVTPDGAWRPLYWRDAGISLAASLALGFLAVWFVEFFNRKEIQPPGPSTVILPQPWMAIAQPIGPALGAGSASSPPLPGGQDTRLLGNPLPRELRSDEVEKLLASAAPENLAILACLLCGLSADEVVSLRRQHVDTATDTLQVPGESSRALPLPAQLLALTAHRHAGSPDTPLFLKAKDRALDAEDIHSVVTSSAYDAELEHPQSITPVALRHTYVAFLVRQGLRFSELVHLVGRLSAETFNMLAPLAPDAQRVSVDSVERLLPALRTR
ncbi:GumC family protein [Rhodoferax ferrireducens]|uniref:GumC family protein n=1 Tax=Rhodoferax ferrireducens TaxID=192843 RepID=UPI000E0DCA9E|nr:tyrosine-type recombinase/integrase [Rhodoferax ferrireducens]